ncbi:hypothetical protein P175DRAFT_0489631 [Aspergillus ochraceoroseus IBT 24754]|uniref:Uncharacterized protein n=3 Tax=Aspergillus subgen. Nidulantes TaxID=2720870 RepID=A0A0F8UYZ5_9EURO|nr:uncharacterized protein P175DRAFT_0489631 [Aspergillus ochraceoroseus IBT 24754]KKK20825.1 hypothetical protein AOCH_002333 [Aspergillus ochraceoroseus]KKK24723.1 hypothetical protein ARAM_004720 [Aspergillus rambellii]PTU24517.1 hypothetical protein P175DRAFT_0489631 [Aspergillus ochraceoroseus IBT 24754]
MSYNRVIQDSDDDDDPLELVPGPPDCMPVMNGDDIHFEPQDVGHGSHIGVNFDEFIQSQDAAHATMTASQQQREERWIPDVGKGGSIGTMMTEIGLAQQRLFDDDQAQFAYPEAPHLQQDTTVVYGQDPNLGVGPDQGGFVQETNTFPQPAPSDDWSQSAPSYNIFESSLRTSSYPLDRADFLPGSEVTVRTAALQNTSPRRCASMHVAISSPHDTEPFSSVISPKASRAKSDNFSVNAVQPSPASIDELALPVAIEIPQKVEKRGRKKKQQQQVILDHDEDDELSYPKVQDPPPNKPEKRKPGRPPKTPQSVPLPSRKEDGATLGEANSTIDGSIGTSIPSPQIIVDESNTKSHPPIAVLAATEGPSIEILATTPTRETKKKKLKRGKTTSAVLTKTYESDVEDDVIWVDERPVMLSAHMDQQPALNLPETTNSNQRNEQGPAPEPAPAPKKRGRKRKQTSEQLDEETNTTNQHQEQPIILQEADAEHPLENTNTNTTTSTGLSIVFESTSKPTDPETLEPPFITSTNPRESTEPSQPPETPKKSAGPQTPLGKGPRQQHSPISSTTKVPYRVGLSKRARIAPLLKIIKR